MVKIFLAYLEHIAEWPELAKNLQFKNASSNTDYIEGAHGLSSWITRNRQSIGDRLIEVLEIGKRSKLVEMYRELQANYPTVCDMIWEIVWNDNMRERERNMADLLNCWMLLACEPSWRSPTYDPGFEKLNVEQDIKHERVRCLVQIFAGGFDGVEHTRGF